MKTLLLSLKSSNLKWMGVLSFAMCLLVAQPSLASAGHAYGHGGSGDLGLESKLLKKIYFILNYQSKLGLSQDQVEKIKDLKVNIKSDVIRDNAEVDVFAYQILLGLNEYDIDANELQDLVKKKHDAMASLDAKVVNAHSDLKSILTDEQYQKAKSWWHRA